MLQIVYKFDNYVPTFLMTHRQTEGISSIRIFIFLLPCAQGRADWRHRVSRTLVLQSACSCLTSHASSPQPSFPEVTGGRRLALHTLRGGPYLQPSAASSTCNGPLGPTAAASPISPLPTRPLTMSPEALWLAWLFGFDIHGRLSLISLVSAAVSVSEQDLCPEIEATLTHL